MIRKINGWEVDEESLNYLSSHIQIDEKILLSIENHIKKMKSIVELLLTIRIGKISVRTGVELDTVVQKLRKYYMEKTSFLGNFLSFLIKRESLDLCSY